MSVLLALAASLLWGFADFGAGVGARRLPVLVVAAIGQTAGLLLAGAVLLGTRASTPSREQFGWAAFAGLIGVVGIGAFYRALAIGTMGVVGPITATAAIVPVAYALVRGERPSTLQGVGVGLAVVGVVAASLEHVPERAARRFGVGVGLALIAALSFGGSLIGLSRAAPGGTAWAVFTMRASVVPLVLIAMLVLKPRLPATRRLWLLLVGVGIGDSAATLLFGAASTRGLLSVVAVLSSLYPIVIVVLARVLLAERVARPQLAGVALALTGVALISAG
ncbi:MAG: DMT family transporter [Actinomycetota bacterium]